VYQANAPRANLPPITRGNPDDDDEDDDGLEGAEEVVRGSRSGSMDMEE